ncbi:hypothetical protein PHYBLDRAFT_146076 [Phycomyces blakesleeanus NRRL 1555(-)]|uniref:Uncharacterized protein n=1 Tax=Phycomyces blakesleeanus (strain ATCC 8743b / DSM 1359 / FGSC 10004 / NBRC 33097 / NRRL 1555) TaxID=763407 RepID=A0A162X672_PHYB8|nr:hypothetical protein PHYBLDRAFT_146076 [Phycomyces blakesleeanus NRRL 1555(-)]OAD72755.1 hypothetical protein PHYBLDRAFT_146076 [Phycomyces blakesleeanus NRRL 1555(-)]|eukprot:XP_018290795.1 hypothetical protein PHYBLDRAFT_146076 [Phycomyces blakesleeanus NRRL 1555(-)]
MKSASSPKRQNCIGICASVSTTQKKACIVLKTHGASSHALFSIILTQEE